jgi:hypothetical protein
MLKPNKKKQIGGTDVIRAALNMVRSMDSVRVSLVNEISELKNFSRDFNNASTPAVGVPNQINGPPK